MSSRLTTPLAELAARSRSSPFDAVVVGGGSAGITVARTLAEHERRVALLEAGPLVLLSHIQSTDLRFDPDLARAVQAALQYSPVADDGTPFGSLIGCVGGRGLFWNGAAPRFAPGDFAGWPVSYEELEPHYAWGERELRVTRAYGDSALGEAVCRQLRRVGLPAEAGPYAVDNHSTRNGWLAGTVGNSLAPLLRTALLTASQRILLATRAFALRVVIAGGAAYGVEVADRDTGALHTVFGRSVVLAAGAFESVRLAMVSGVPDPNGLVGRFISDHLFCRAYYPMPPELYDPVRPEVAIAWVPAGGGRGYQLEIHLPADNLFVLQETTSWKPDRSVYYAAMVRAFAPVQPRHDNYLEPLPGDEPGRFRVYLSLSPDDLARRDQMTAGLEQVRSALGGDSAEVRVMPQGASHHEAGGLVMGESAASSVVDGYGRFRSVERLVVADAAAWPDVSAANPHLTIIAFSRRAAGQLHADL